MQPYNNYKLEVNFEIPTGWVLMDNEEAMVTELGISADEAVPTAFVAVNTAAKAKDVQYLTCTHDMAIYATEEDYLNGLKSNLQELAKAGAKISAPETMKSPNGIRVDKVVATVSGLTMVQYYFHINELLVCMSANVSKAGDDLDKVANGIVLSAKM